VLSIGVEFYFIRLYSAPTVLSIFCVSIETSQNLFIRLNFRAPRLSVKPNATVNIQEGSQHGTDLSIAVDEGTREPSDDGAVQRAAIGGYEVPLTLEEINEPVYTELDEPGVSRNPDDATRSFVLEPIYFELDDQRCPSKLTTKDVNKIEESVYVEMSPILYTNVTSSFDDLKPSVDNPIEGQTGKQLIHCTDAGLVQSDETRHYSNLPSSQLSADVAVCKYELNPEYSNIHQEIK
jgi:hypothetical protein